MASFQRFIAQAAHLAEVNLGESGLDLGELQQGQALTIDYDLDTFLAGVGYTKQLLAIMSKDTGSAVFKTNFMDLTTS